uniref:Candidate secreted effector n=1 Tax=Meloidogyne incognita TaxID=6306 RepID=A0A914M832_MELIC
MEQQLKVVGQQQHLEVQLIQLEPKHLMLEWLLLVSQQQMVRQRQVLELLLVSVQLKFENLRIYYKWVLSTRCSCLRCGSFCRCWCRCLLTGRCNSRKGIRTSFYRFLFNNGRCSFGGSCSPFWLTNR